MDVILTEAAREFVAPLTFQALIHRPVVTEMFSLLAETEMPSSWRGVQVSAQGTSGALAANAQL